VKAEIKTEVVVKEETMERVHLSLSIQEAHLIESLLGATDLSVASKFGVTNPYDTWLPLFKTLGSPWGNPNLDVSVVE
jgi:hypothetical protein